MILQIQIYLYSNTVLKHIITEKLLLLSFKNIINLTYPKLLNCSLCKSILKL